MSAENVSKKKMSKTRAFFGAIGSGTKRTYIRSKLGFLRRMADKYEDAHVKATDPDLWMHRKIREESANISRKLACLGPAHKKAAKYMEEGVACLQALVGSQPDNIDAHEAAQTEAAIADLRGQVDRLQNDLKPALMRAAEKTLEAVS